MLYCMYMATYILFHGLVFDVDWFFSVIEFTEKGNVIILRKYWSLKCCTISCPFTTYDAVSNENDTFGKPTNSRKGMGVY